MTTHTKQVHNGEVRVLRMAIQEPTEMGEKGHLRGNHLLHRGVVLDTGGHNLRSPLPQSCMRGLQQLQKHREATDQLQIPCIVDALHNILELLQQSRLLIDRGGDVFLPAIEHILDFLHSIIEVLHVLLKNLLQPRRMGYHIQNIGEPDLSLSRYISQNSTQHNTGEDRT